MISDLLTGPSVRLPRPPAPMHLRDLTDRGGGEKLTLAATVAQMKLAFASVAELVTSVERVWAAMTPELDGLGAQIGQARELAAGMGDETLTAMLAASETELGRLRRLLNCDPLELWQGGMVDDAPLGRLRAQAAGSVAQIRQLDALRANQQQRIAAAGAEVAAARFAGRDAEAARDRAAARIAGPLPPLPDPAVVPRLAAAVAALPALEGAARLHRLTAELDVVEKQAAAITRQYRDAEKELTALVRRRDELRGLLDAYEAKAKGLGISAEPGLSVIRERARDLLGAAPCQLAAAQDAVAAYQAAIKGLT